MPLTVITVSGFSFTNSSKFGKVSLLNLTWKTSLLEPLKSININSPWSRTLATQPAKVTSSLIFDSESWTILWLLYSSLITIGILGNSSWLMFVGWCLFVDDLLLPTSFFTLPSLSTVICDKISSRITFPEAPLPIILMVFPTKIPAFPWLPFLISFAIASFSETTLATASFICCSEMVFSSKYFL